MDDRSRHRPPTGPAPAAEAEEEVTAIPLVLEDGGVLPRRPFGAGVADEPAEGQTRKIDTKPLVSAAFEAEEEPSEELGFDRPLFTGEEEEHPTPQAAYASAAEVAAGGRRLTESSVVVDMDFEEREEENTPASLWTPGPGLAASEQRGSEVIPERDRGAEIAARQRRPRPQTGPQPLGARRHTTEIALPTLGSARKKDRQQGGSGSTGRLPQQERGGRSRVLIYVIVGGLLGLGVGLFFGLRHGGEVEPEPKAVASALSAESRRTLAEVAGRRSVSAVERKNLRALRLSIDGGAWKAALSAFERLPERLQRDVVVRIWLARVQRGQGDPAAAVATLQKQLDRAPTAALRVEVGVELAEALLAAGKQREALAAIQRAKVELDADASEALAARVLRVLRRCK